MKFLCALLSLLATASLTPIAVAATPVADWPGWRGPTGDGQAAPGQNPPIKWNEQENVLWRVAIPGKGHGSPTVVGHRIYLPTADEAAEQQRVLCLDRATGKIVWDTVVHHGKLYATVDRNSSHASSTVASDGERLYISLLNAA